MTQTVLDEYIFPVLVRYVDCYGWNFTISTQLINRYYGTDYTVKKLKALYQKSRKVF